MSDAETARPPDEPKAGKRRGPFLNLLLFLATLCTTWMAGLGGRTIDEEIRNGFIYMACVIGILLAHEMGHYVMARRNRVDVSLPYFIPFPFGLFGTLGAVIVMRGRIRSRNALMEVGAAGPFAGMAVAIPILLAGLSLSAVEPIPAEGLMEGQSILYLLLKRIAVGPIPPGYDVMLHPMAWAGWIGLLVTMLNLFPIGQLDGGHVFYALWGKAHLRVSRLFHAGLFLLGLGVIGWSALDAEARGLAGDAYWTQLLTGANWLVLGLLIWIVSARSRGGLRHPPTDDDRLSPRHRAFGIACLAMLALTFTPIPIRVIV